MTFGAEPFDSSAWDIDFSKYEIDAQVDQPDGIGLNVIHHEFNAQSREAGLRFGDDKEHSVFTAVFMAALATKPFVILSGVSGSGKTQLATTFGEWLGPGHVLVQPVRPDWESPQPLLGHEYGSSESDETTSGWHVPRTLAFMLAASRNPHRPYMLVLEEMNLAHVERYFADVLSGMESGQPIIPNLRYDGKIWRMSEEGADYLPWPRNLYVVGSINVDETTYDFSPKVIDRAGILEFRVTSDSLMTNYPPKKPIVLADQELLEAFVKRTQGEARYWAGQSEVSAALKTVHEAFYQHAAEFGHRVFKDSLRFGAMLNEIGITDLNEILDLILMQRIIPKFDSKRGFNQALLLKLSGIAVYGADDQFPIDPVDAPEDDVALPRTLRTLKRIAIDHMNQL